MKSEKEKLLNSTYQNFLQISLADLSLDGLDDILDQNIMGYGTALNEKIFSISDYRDLISRQREQGKEIEMKHDFTPVLRKKGEDGNSAVFVDEVTLTMTANGEKHELFLRVSSVLEYIKEKWVVVHFHGSKPEYTDGEKDTWHINELKQKTEALERTVAEKTSDLEIKNKELKIEASLERIRTVAMSMQKSEGLLDVVEILNGELKTLGFTDIRNSIINIFNDSKELFLNYDYSDYGVGGISEVDYNSHPSNSKFVIKMREASQDFMITEFTGNELDEWKKWRNEQGQMPDPKLDQAEGLYYYEYSIGVGSIGISTFSPINDDQLEILKKIRNVFDLAYRRYTDIAQAEAHAREAKIETGLERVRASAMAMHKSEQLSETAKILFEEIAILGNIPDRMSIGIIDEKSKNVELWVTDQGGNDLNHEFFFSIEEPTSISKIYSAWKEGKDFVSVDLTGKNLKAWLQFVKNEAKLPIDQTEIKGRRVQQAAFFSHGFLLLTTHQPISDEIMNLLVRFARVFNQTYTRFLDLVNAEEQAREAQIEVALEKVRSRSLAMHTSEELADTATLLFEQLQTLGELPDRVGICIINEEKKYFEQWVTNQNGKFLGHQINASIAESTTMSKLYDAWKEKKDYLIIVLQDDELKKWMKFVREELKIVVDDTKINGRRIHNGVFFSHGLFLYTTHEPLSNEVIQLLIRFVKVFEQTYTRFLDLQKAEEQAREAQIEVALERVRVIVLSMKETFDMIEMCRVISEQLEILNVSDVRNVQTAVINETKGTFLNYEYYGGYDKSFITEIDYHTHPTQTAFITQMLTSSDAFFSRHFKRSELKDWLDHQRETDQFIDPNLEVANSLNYYFHSIGLVALGVSTYSPLNNKDLMIFQRFRNVFELAYRRFIDIEIAMEQAKEAKIEAALERVRSKTMAMHNSEDVGETVATLFDEVMKLGLDDSIRCGIGILEGNEGMETWSATSHANGDVDLNMGMLDMTIHPMLIGLKKAWKSGAKDYSYDYIGEDVLKYYTSLNDEPEYPIHIDLDTLPENEYHNSFFFNEGILFSFTSNPITEEAAKVLDRFASLFGQTYRRYLDLQKAESQAREAQIEAALERVRARAMSLHKSDELKGVIAILYHELNQLGLDLYDANICIQEKATKDLTFWGSGLGGVDMPPKFTIPYLNRSVLRKLYYDRDKEVRYRSFELKGKELKNYHKICTTETEFKDAPKEYLEEMLSVNRIFLSHVSINHGLLEVASSEALSDNHAEILQRFGSVVDLTYTRFDDLIQAEAQTREAKIEVALERVRVRTMAMHKSDELNQVVHSVYKELQHLEFDVNMCLILIYDEYTGGMDWWSSGFGKDILPQSYKIPPLDKFIENPMARRIIEAREKDSTYEVYELKGEVKRDWDKILFEHTELRNLPEEFKQSMLAAESVILSEAYMSCGILEVSGSEPLSNENASIVQRFAKVIDQIYTRFSDLKKAEAQNIIIQADNERKTQELEEARELQLSMLPKELPNLENLDIAVYMQTATEVGGDYYDFHVGTDGTLTAVIGDATGHGMKAGTIVTITKSQFNSLASEQNILDSFSKISNVIKDMNFKQLSMCLMMLKISDKELTISSAAMPPALIFRKQKREVEELTFEGMPLGSMKNYPYKEIKTELHKGDTILLLSDGLPELQNDMNEMYGYERTIKEFNSVGEKTPEKIVDHLTKSASEWMNGEDQDDDVTFVVIKVLST